MQIMTRKEASAAGEYIYITGNPCRNGHTAYRYVQSGTCSECINGNRKSSRTRELRESRNNVAANIIQSREVISSTFNMYNVVVAAPDVDMVKSMVIAYAMLRAPAISPGAVWLSKRPKVGVIYSILMHPHDYEQLRPAIESMFDVHKGVDKLLQTIKDRITAPDFTPKELIK